MNKITQVGKFDDLERITTSGQASSIVLVNAKHDLLVYGLNESPSRLQLAFLGANPQMVAVQQQRPAASCAYINAALSADGNHLLVVCGPAQPYLEFWSLSPLQPLLVVDIEPQCHGTAGHARSNCSPYTSLQQYCVCRLLSVLLSYWQLGGLQYQKDAHRGSLL